MADIIELEVVGKVTGLKPMLSTVSRLEREITRATKALDENKISQDRHQKVLLSAKREYSSLGMSIQKAGAEVTKYSNAIKNTSAEQKAAQATKMLANEKDQLARKYQPLYAATQLYERGLVEIQRATKLGVLTNEEAIASTARLQTSFTNATANMGKGISQAGRQTNQLGVVAQQTGYQVGDFLVQIQSGANPMMAFGQQATQLVGVLPMLSTQLGISASKLMGIAAGLGILIPLATAIAGYFLRSASAAKDAANEQETLTESLESQINTLNDASMAWEDFRQGLFEGQGGATRQMEAAAEAVTEARRVLNDIDGANITSGRDSAALIQLYRNIRDLREAQEDLNEKTELYDNLLEAASRRSEQLAEDAVILARQEIALLAEQIVSGEDSLRVRELSNEQARIAYALSLSNKGIIDDEARLLEHLFAVRQNLTEEQRRQNALEEDRASADEILADLQQQLALQTAIHESGADSVEVSNLRAAAERDTLLALVQSLDIHDDTRTSIMEAHDTTVLLTGQINNATTAAERLANAAKDSANALAAMSNFTAGITIRIAQARAQLEAIESGANAANAGMVAGERARIAIQRDTAVASALAAGSLDDLSEATRRYQVAVTEVDSLEEVLNATAEAQENAAASTSAGGGAMDDAAKSAEQLAQEIRALEFNANPLLAYNEALENLNMLLGMDNGLSVEAYARAVDDLNRGLIESDPLVKGVSDAFRDFMGRGFTDFKTFVADILQLFKNMLIEMAMTALRNRILIPMSVGKAGGGGGGIANSLMGSLGTGKGIAGLAGGTGFLGGAGNVIGGIASGGLGGGVSAIGTAISAATTAGTASLATFAAAAGAIAVPLLAVTAVFSFFKKKVTELDGGVRITVNGMESMIESFRTIETKKFWGLSKKVSTSFSELDEAVAGPLEKTIYDIQMGIVDTATALGVGASAFDNFASSITVSTKGMDAEAANAAILAALTGFADEFAGIIPGLAAVTREGDTATSALTNIASALNLVNPAFAMLGSVFGQFESTLEGGALARNMADTFGGFEAFAQITTDYYTLAYSQAEQLSHANDSLRQAFASLGMVMPSTLAGLRALVEQAARMGKMEQAAALMQLSVPLEALLTGQADFKDTSARDLRAAFEREMAATRERFDLIISDLAEKLTGARETLNQSRAIASALTDALQARIFPSAEAQRQSLDEAAGYLKSLVGQGRITDEDAFRNALSIVANPSTDTYSTLVDYTRDFNKTSVVIRDLEESAKHILSLDEQIVANLEEQIKQAELDFDIEIGMLEDQLNALLGIDTSILSLADAIKAFLAARESAGIATGGVTSGGDAGFSTSLIDFTNASNSRAIEQIYQDVLGRTADAAGLAFYVQAAQTMSILDIASNIRASSEAITGVIPSYDVGTNFHPGGLAYVHKDELINLPRGSSVSTVEQTRNMMNQRETLVDRTRPTSKPVSELGSSSNVLELRREISELRIEQRQILMDISKNTKRTSDLERKHDIQGTPPVRAA